MRNSVFNPLNLVCLLMAFFTSIGCADNFKMACKELEEKMYAKTLDNSGFFKWVEAMNKSFEESRMAAKSNSVISQSAINEYIHYFNLYKNANHLSFTKAGHVNHYTFAITDMYCAYVRAIYAMKGFAREERYDTIGLKIGKVSNEAVNTFLESLHTAGPKRFTSFDGNEERYFVPLRYSDQVEEVINIGQVSYDLGQEQLNALAPIIRELTPSLDLCVGAPWRIVNVLCWETKSNAREGMTNWHTDGMPTHVRKVLVFLTGASRSTGTTEFQLSTGNQIIEGPPGTWAYARVSELNHRGIPPSVGNRIVVELRIVPSLEHEYRPFSAGFHSFYPLVPWFNPFEN